jgi:uncharacterized membrane protein
MGKIAVIKIRMRSGDVTMRRWVSVLIVVVALALTFGVRAPGAEEAPAGIKGFFLLTDYPAVTVRPGTAATISMRLQNYALPPENLKLGITGVPAGWTATLLGGGQPVAAAMPLTNQSVSLQLRLDVPASAAMGTQTVTVTAGSVSLPVSITLAKDLPAKLTVEPQLPSLRGTSKSSFEYQLNIKNDSGRNLVVSFAAQAPANYETTFTEQYGSQEISSMPIEGGQSKGIKLKVRPPSTIGAGSYPVKVRVTAEDTSAETSVTLEIVGQPRLSITGTDGRLNGTATAGKESTIQLVVINTGTAPAEEVELSGSAPTGWKIAFEPKTIDRIPPGDKKEVQAQITASDKAVAGDYVATLRASARAESASNDFRIAVTTSTLWGIIGFGIIGVAFLIMVGAVARFGRR